MADPKTQRINPHVARLLADRTQFVLSKQDWLAFSEALDRAAQADPALLELFQRPRPA